MTGSAASTCVGRQRVEVELVGEPRRQPPRDLRSVAADEDRDPRLLQPLRLVDGVADVSVSTLERRPAGAEHPGDDLELIGEDGQSLAGRREAVAVGQPLVLLPAGADAEDRPAAADHVDRRDALGGEPGVAIRRGEHEVAEPRPARLGGERRELRERLEDRRLLGRRIDLHVVVDPERLEAEILGPLGDLDGPSPGRRGVHPEVLAIAALRQRQPELHAVGSLPRIGSLDELPDPAHVLVGRRDHVCHREPQAGVPNVRTERPERLADVVPGDRPSPPAGCRRRHGRSRRPSPPARCPAARTPR